ncbi:MAG: VCBS repeat-containing protein, partial [SAR202 cluster bacterium]|nr:VCBS repeat-containing protein [SAR202 cluster bacterium]
FLATDGVQGGPLPRHLVGFGNGNGTFALQATLLPRVADWGGRNMAVADFDRDGYLDLAIFTKALYGNAAEVGIYLNNGAAGRGFTAAPVLDIGPVSGTTIPGAGIAAADFNRDGLLDIVVHSGVTNDPFEGSSNDRLLLFTGRGDGTFNAASVVGTGLPEVDEFAAGDLNGDGRMDLVGIGGSVWVLMGNGDGTFAEQVAYGAGGNPVALQLIDMNGDRVLDIAAGATNGAFSVLRGNGNGTFQDAQLFAIGMVGALTVSVGDLNGDGLQDVVVGHPSTNRNSFTVLIQQP